jgi:hypothetical protein
MARNSKPSGNLGHGVATLSDLLDGFFFKFWLKRGVLMDILLCSSHKAGMPTGAGSVQ